MYYILYTIEIFGFYSQCVFSLFSLSLPYSWLSFYKSFDALFFQFSFDPHLFFFFLNNNLTPHFFLVVVIPLCQTFVVHMRFFYVSCGFFPKVLSRRQHIGVATAYKNDNDSDDNDYRKNEIDREMKIRWNGLCSCYYSTLFVSTEPNRQICLTAHSIELGRLDFNVI